MKTGRRHELQTNQLADALAHGIERVKPYSKAIMSGLLAILVAIFAWGFVSAQSTRRVADGWNEYFEATDSPNPRDALADVAARYPGSEAGLFAELTLADMLLDIGTNQLFANKTIARDEL